MVCLVSGVWCQVSAFGVGICECVRNDWGI